MKDEGIFEKLGGRKYFTSLLFSLLCFLGFIFGKVSFEEFKIFFLLLNAAYFTANTVAKFAPEN